MRKLLAAAIAALTFAIAPPASADQILGAGR